MLAPVPGGRNKPPASRAPVLIRLIRDRHVEIIYNKGEFNRGGKPMTFRLAMTLVLGALLVALTACGDDESRDGDDYGSGDADSDQDTDDWDGPCEAVCVGECDVPVEGTCIIEVVDYDCPGICIGTCDYLFEGHCEGICHGQCNGYCDLVNSYGDCEGYCEGTCFGTCDLSDGGPCENLCTGICCYAIEAGEECLGTFEGLCSTVCTGACVDFEDYESAC